MMMNVLEDKKAMMLKMLTQGKSWSCRKLEDYASFWRKEGSGEKEELSMKQFVFLQPKMMNIVIERSKKTIKRIVEMVAAVKASQQTVHNTLASDNLTVPC